MKQTAVEWLVEKLDQNFDYVADTIIEQAKAMEKEQITDGTMPAREAIQQAKAMEKEQIIESYCIGCADITKDNNIFPRETSEQYYNETYEQSKQG